MPPEALTTQGSSVVDVSTDALRCVQFSGAAYGVINTNIVGVRSGPGQEDCLKLWVWKPVNISAGAMLPVMFYIHVSRVNEKENSRSMANHVSLTRAVAYNTAQLPTMISVIGLVRAKTSSL